MTEMELEQLRAEMRQYSLGRFRLSRLASSLMSESQREQAQSLHSPNTAFEAGFIDFFTGDDRPENEAFTLYGELRQEGWDTAASLHLGGLEAAGARQQPL